MLVSCLESVDDQSGILIPPGDSHALSAALLQSYHVNWNREAIREKMINNFSWEIWTKKLLALIN